MERPGTSESSAANPQRCLRRRPPPSTVKFAAGVVKGVIVDMVPPSTARRRVCAGAIVAAWLLLFGLRLLRNRCIARRRYDDDFEGLRNESSKRASRRHGSVERPISTIR